MLTILSRRDLLAAGLAGGFALSPLGALAQVAKIEPKVFVKNARRYVTDMLGRTVEIPAKVNRIVCTGTGAPRIACYLNALDKMVGIESSDQVYEHDPKRDYAFAHYARFKKMPQIGKGGGNAFTANPEAVLSLEPDVILTGYAPEAVKQLERETGLPVISVYYRSLGLVNDTFLQSIRMTGEVLGLQERAGAIESFVAAAIADLKKRVAGVDAGKSPTVYTGAVTFFGGHGFSGTYNRFGPLSVLNARSISDRPGKEGFYDADLEFVLHADPQVIFLDPSNLPIVRQEVKTRRGYFESLSAVRENRVYTMPSYNQYSTNVTYSLANAYYAGTILFPDRFADVDFPAKFDEIVSFFNGRGWYDKMAHYGQGYGTVNLLEG